MDKGISHDLGAVGSFVATPSQPFFEFLIDPSPAPGFLLDWSFDVEAGPMGKHPLVLVHATREGNGRLRDLQLFEVKVSLQRRTRVELHGFGPRQVAARNADDEEDNDLPEPLVGPFWRSAGPLRCRLKYDSQSGELTYEQGGTSVSGVTHLKPNGRMVLRLGCPSGLPEILPPIGWTIDWQEPPRLTAGAGAAPVPPRPAEREDHPPPSPPSPPSPAVDADVVALLEEAAADHERKAAALRSVLLAVRGDA